MEGAPLWVGILDELKESGMNNSRIKIVLAICAVLVIVAPALASDAAHSEKAGVKGSDKNYSPFVGQDFPKQLYWGDTHLHTANSLDAGLFGTKLLPGDAYRFARGEEVVSSTGQAVKLHRPLDFMVVADHSEYAGIFGRKIFTACAKICICCR